MNFRRRAAGRGGFFCPDSGRRPGRNPRAGLRRRRGIKVRPDGER